MVSETRAAAAGLKRAKRQAFGLRRRFRLPTDPQRRLLSGDPRISAAASQQGELIATVGERMAERLGLNRVQAAVALS